MGDKKKLKALGILGAASLLSLTACAFNPFSNRPVCVYGPPPSEEDNFDPSENEPDEVYGPPSYWDNEDDDNPEDDSEDTYEEYEDDLESDDEDGLEEQNMDEEYDPAANIEPCVYGPPEGFQSYSIENSSEEDGNE